MRGIPKGQVEKKSGSNYGPEKEIEQKEVTISRS
jgi:hypothetical protein